MLLAPDQRLEVPATLDAVRDLASWLKVRCLEAEVDEATSFDLELAMVEAANNVVEHGYRGMKAGTITLQFGIMDGAVVLTLFDMAPPAPAGLFERCRTVELDAPDGRGVMIVRSCVDTVEYRQDGNTNLLTLTKRLPASS